MVLKDLIENQKVIVCVGTGGVGKTTVSAALGVLAAKYGKRVLVLTVDPAQRLATALGVTLDLGDSDSKVNIDCLSGEMFAAVVNPKAVFDSFVHSHCPDEGDRQRILDNRIYQKLSTELSGSQEFTALERYYRAWESNKYDLIILDTPPSSHALDFLDSASRLADLFQETVVKWFVQPTQSNGLLSQLIHRGTHLAFKALERLTGSEFVKELVEFFLVIYSLRVSLLQRLESIQSSLKSEGTSFLLVTSYDKNKIELAKNLHDTLAKRGYSMDQVIVNRCFPEIDLSKLEGKPFPENPSNEMNELGVEKLVEYYSKVHRSMEPHRIAVTMLQKELGGQLEICLVSDQNQDVYDIDGLLNFANSLESASDFRRATQESHR